MEILIRNGVVYDPLNNVKGEVMDIGVKNGKIVDASEIDATRAKVINASGKLVVPGGIDVHSHIAGPKVNTGRLIVPEDHYKTNIPARLPTRRAQTGLAVPNVFKIGYGYAEMGFTFVAEPASPPLKTRHTHEELNAIPMIDKLTFILVDSNWIALDYIDKGEIDKLAVYLAWLLKATKGYALKLVDSGSDVGWLYGRMSLDLDEQVPGYNLTPRDIIVSIGEAAEKLNLPHQIHVHCNKLGYPGNYKITTETMKMAGKYATGKRPSMHITHVQFTGYAGDCWSELRSGAEDIAKELNKNPNVTLDLGQLILGYTAVTMTGDAPFEYVLYHLTKGKWAAADVEAEGSSGIVPYTFKKKNFVNTIQWAIGLEVALMAKDVWRVFLTTDHPNAGPFTAYPEVMVWLMSKKAREEYMKEVNQRALSKCALPSLDREYTLEEIMVMTRASPAKLLGIEKFKGHLGVGADADIAIYNIDPREIDPSRDYERVKKALRRAAYTIKSGEIVVANGKVVKTVYGSTYYVEPKVPEDLEKQVEAEVREKFRNYYSVAIDNYIISESELKKPAPITVETSF